MDKPLPLDLPRIVMRRAAGVGLVTLLLAALLGLQRAADNIADEVDAAAGLAGLVARLGQLDGLDDPSALREVRAALSASGLRHLELRLRSADGRIMLSPETAPADPEPLATLIRWHRHWLSSPEHRLVSWQLNRPGSAPWILTLSPSPDSERREALANLSGMLLILAAGIAVLLLVMQWNVRRALRPLATLLQAIADIETRDPASPMTPLPPMPIRELERIAQALRHLGEALDAAEQRRRLLARKVLTLQEDERHHLARELHDEFGQRLTALRFDAAWLSRRLADEPALREVVDGMAERCAEVQRDIRDLLVRLRPFGPAVGPDPGPEGVDHSPLPLAELVQLLQPLVDGWRDAAARAGHCSVTLQLQQLAPGATAREPTPAELAQPQLPRALALALYRITQEALTNAVRHAGARQVKVTLSWSAPGSTAPGSGARLLWRVEDDGVGIASLDLATRRGNGLAGMQERVWALGGQWHLRAAQADGSGVILEASLPCDAPGPGVETGALNA